MVGLSSLLPRVSGLLLLLLCGLSLASRPAVAALCPADQFGAAVDQSGASLRDFNAQAQPQLNQGFQGRPLAQGCFLGCFEKGIRDFDGCLHMGHRTSGHGQPSSAARPLQVRSDLA